MNATQIDTIVGNNNGIRYNSRAARNTKKLGKLVISNDRDGMCLLCIPQKIDEPGNHRSLASTGTTERHAV